MVAIDVETPLPEVIQLMADKGHSRYPVFRGSIDHPIGLVYAKDLFRLFVRSGPEQGKLEDSIRTPLFFAAESQKISDLLRQMQARRTHLAIVVDEKWRDRRMVTLEDIIEEIVGEIRDEHDVEDAPVKQIAPGRYLAKADVSVHDLAEITGLVLPENAAGYESLGGMLIDLAGRVPRSGESMRSVTTTSSCAAPTNAASRASRSSNAASSCLPRRSRGGGFRGLSRPSRLDALSARGTTARPRSARPSRPWSSDTGA